MQYRNAENSPKEEFERIRKEILANPDIKNYPNLYICCFILRRTPFLRYANESL